MPRDWNRAVRNIHDAHDSDADEENRILGVEFKERFRRGDFDAEVRIGDKRYKYADWYAIDQFLRR